MAKGFMKWKFDPFLRYDNRPKTYLRSHKEAGNLSELYICVWRPLSESSLPYTRITSGFQMSSTPLRSRAAVRRHTRSWLDKDNELSHL